MIVRQPLTTPAEIPVLDCGPDFPLRTLEVYLDRAHALLDLATARVPKVALRQLDAVSRAWLVKWNNAHLAEIDAVARRLDRPGAHFFSVNYEWGCTCRVAPSPDETSARLIRVLDWKTPGLGRNIVAARVAAPAGRYVTLTWPGTRACFRRLRPGVSAWRSISSHAQGRGVLLSGLGGQPAAGLDHAASHAGASVAVRLRQRRDVRCRRRETSVGAHFDAGDLFRCGACPGETAVIERCETEARVHRGSQVAANHWQAHGWSGHPRGGDSAGRAAMMQTIAPVLGPDFAWLRPPVLNARTRLAMVGDARAGRVVAQGYEDGMAATTVLAVDA